MKGAILLLVSLGLGSLVHAHHDPASEAALLTAEMNAKGATVELLCQRAQLWRTLRKSDLAIEDYLQATQLNPKISSTHLKLAQTYFAEDQLKPAFKSVETGLKLAEQNNEKASLLMLRASIYRAWKSFKKAAADADAAFEALPKHRRIDWYLQRAHAQRMAGLFKSCATGLREGFDSTGSAVLHAQWVDALIDAKAAAAALVETNKQLSKLRFSASWRIRHARALRELKRDDEAQTELEKALAELNQRIKPDADYPDITLLIDRGLAHLLLGNRKEARQDYDRAKAAGAMGWMHWRLDKAFGS